MYHWHNGILTSDLEKTLDSFCAIPGVTRDLWTLGELDFTPGEMVTGAGGRLKTAFARIGGIVYELLEPLDDTSYHAVTLRKRGPGLHHAAYVCEDNLDEVIAAQLAAGGKIVWEALHGDEHAIYIESSDGSMVYEFINVCPFMPAE